MRIPVHQLSILLLDLYEDILDSTNKGEDRSKRRYRNDNKDNGYDRSDGNSNDDNN